MRYSKFNSLFLKLSVCLIVISVVSVSVTIIMHVKEVRSEKDESILDTPKQALDYLMSHSTIFTDSMAPITYVKWPSENITLNLVDSQLLYAKVKEGKQDTLRVHFSNVSNATAANPLNSCKAFDVEVEDEGTSLMSDFKDAVRACTSISIDSASAEEISTNEELSENDKALSHVYNVIVGAPEGFIVLGNDNGTWKRFNTKDFPQYVIETEELILFAKMHQEHPDKSPKECYTAHPFVSKYTAYPVYLNLRHDTVVEQDGVRKKDADKTLTFPLDSLKYYKGWVNYQRNVNQDSLEWFLESAYSYYVGSSRMFVNVQDPQTITLGNAMWKEQSVCPLWLIYIMYGIALLFIIVGLLSFYLYRKQTRFNDEDVRQVPVQLPTNPIGNEKLLQEKVVILERELRNLKNEKQVEIDRAISRAISDYKAKNNIQALIECEKEWRNFVGITSSQVLHKRLCEIQQKHPSFPTLVTINNVCENVKNESNDSREQIKKMFQYIDAKVDAKLKWGLLFDQLCQNADYAKKVRESYDATATYVSQWAKNKELQALLAKQSLNYWDRLALSRWAIVGFNQLLGAFKQHHLTQENLQTTQDMLLSDLFQQYLARVFMDGVDQGKDIVSYSVDSDKLINERIAKLASEYAIAYNPATDAKYQKARQTFAQAYDDIAGTKAFVDRMESHFVKEFYANVETSKDRAWFFSMMVGMGYHMVDFVRRRNGVPSTLCPNYNYLLADFDEAVLSKDAKFLHNDYEHSVEYTNRIYEWLDQLGVEHLKALVGRQLIKP